MGAGWGQGRGGKRRHQSLTQLTFITYLWNSPPTKKIYRSTQKGREKPLVLWYFQFSRNLKEKRSKRNGWFFTSMYKELVWGVSCPSQRYYEMVVFIYFMLFFYPIAKVDVIWTSSASCIRNTSSHHLNFSFFLPAASLCWSLDKSFCFKR